MFRNVGRVIRTLAVVNMAFGFAVMIWGLFGLLAAMGGEELLLLESVWLFLAGIAIVVSAFPLYGFGQLVEDVRQIRQTLWDRDGEDFS